MTINEQAIEAVTQKRMEQNECEHTMSSIECDMHGEPFVITDYADIYGHLVPTGYCPIARQEAEAIIEAALPHLREQIAQEILDKPRAYDIPITQDPSAYTDAYNRAIEAAARIARGEQQ